jgi:hypothetical protein
MTRQNRAIAGLLVTLLVVVACGMSFADPRHGAMGPCGLEKGWGPIKIDDRVSVTPRLDSPAIPLACVAVPEPAPRWTGVESATSAPSRLLLVQRLTPRGPPLA